MNTTKTLGQTQYEAYASPEYVDFWEHETPECRARYEKSASAVRDAVLAESKAASDVLNASLVTLSMEVTKMQTQLGESERQKKAWKDAFENPNLCPPGGPSIRQRLLSSYEVIENLREECRQKDLIIMELRESIGLAPLPAQAPEEQSLEAQTILNLKKHLDRWRSNIRNVVLQGDKTPMDDDTLRDRAYTAIDARVADERRLAKEANSRAESAEARVAALEGELSEAREVLSSIPVKLNHADNCTPAQCICWIKRYLKVLPPTSPPEEETERKAAKKAYDKYVEDAPNGRVATFADFLIGWQAARQSTKN